MVQETRETSQELIRQLAQKFYADRSRHLLEVEIWREQEIFDFLDNFTALLQITERKTDLDIVTKERTKLSEGDAIQIRARLYGIISTNPWNDYLDLFYQKPEKDGQVKTIFYLRYTKTPIDKTPLVGHELHIIKEPGSDPRYLASNGIERTPLFNSMDDFECYFYEPTIGQVKRALQKTWRSRFNMGSFAQIDIPEKVAKLAETVIAEN